MFLSDISFTLFRYLYIRFVQFGYDRPCSLISLYLRDLNPGLSDDEVFHFFKFIYPDVFYDDKIVINISML